MMTYILGLISLCWRTLVQHNSVHYLLIVLCLIFIGILYKVVRIKLQWSQANYEITSFTWNIICVLIYIVCYISLFLYLRMVRIGQTLDLKKLNIFCDFLGAQNAFNQFLLCLIILCLALLWILIFMKLRNFLIREVLKLHFYHKNKFLLTALQTAKEPKFQKYNKFLFALEKYTLDRLLYKYIQRRYTKIACWFIERKLLTDNSRVFKVFDPIIRHIRAILGYSIRLLLLICFIYDCLANDRILYTTLIFLPFFMLFMLWYNLSFFIENTSIVLDRIIFERIYCKLWVLFVNLTKKEELLLSNYLKARLIQKFDALLDAGYDPAYDPIYTKRRFTALWTEERGKFYHNFDEHKTFYDKHIIIIDNRLYVEDPEDTEALDELQYKTNIKNK